MALLAIKGVFSGVHFFAEKEFLKIVSENGCTGCEVVNFWLCSLATWTTRFENILFLNQDNFLDLT